MTEPTLQALREARAELDAVIEEIQQVEGFERFLAAPTFDDVAAAAQERPVVYLAAAELGGLALVVRGEDVRGIELPELNREDVARRAQAYLDRYGEYRSAEGAAGAPRGTPDERRAALLRWDAALAEITAWVWSAAMEPVVDELRSGVAAGSEPPASVLVPGGLLGLLPLHAAWHPDPSRPTGREHVLDLVQVAYAPNARALAAARAVAQDVPGRRVLAVAPPSAANDLPMTATEVRAAQQAFPGGTLQRRPTRAGFLSAIGAADVVHVACHGLADLATPLDSRLLLAPGQAVSLADIMASRVKVRLAILSACETLLPGTALPDEVVSLPTGLIQAGAAGVIASMWAVPDLASAILMIEFYRHWRHTPDDPGGALRRAQVWLRDTPHEERVAWFERAPRASGWPSPAVARDVLDRLALLAPGPAAPGEPAGGLTQWAAFAHVGV